MIQSYFGNGKGKTTAAIGAAIRFAGSGKKVLFVQFLKNNASSECNVLETVSKIDCLHSDVQYKLYDNQNQARTPILSQAYSQLLFQDVRGKADRYQMIILDEILDAVAFGYIDEASFLKLLDELKVHSELILTGHQLSKNIANVSDYISEIKAISHPYTGRTAPREGIEF